MSKIVGVKYVGKKPECEDTVTGSGARWLPGQVHNFASALAEKLLVHTDSFALSPIDIDGETYMSGAPKAVEKEPVAYVNINRMGVEELRLFAKRELNRTIHIDGKGEAEVRTEVHRLMMLASLDEIAQEKAVQPADTLTHIITVSRAELDAINAGTLAVKLVPVVIAMDQTKTDLVESGVNAESNTQPTLAELVASLDRQGLLDLAKQESIEIANIRIKTDQLRTLLLSTLSNKTVAE